MRSFIKNNWPRKNKIPNFTSIDIDELLIDQHKINSKLMPFLHLPIQSGSDRVLKK